MKTLIMRHQRSSIVLLILALCVLAMAITGTLSYPIIMVERQLQLLSRCIFSNSEFVAQDYGFIFLVPNDYCVLPHRLFPEDGSIQIIPRGLYSVINEYAKGTIAAESRASILFDRQSETRNRRAFLATLQAGGFLDGATVEEHTNSTGVKMTIVRNARGIESGKLFQWAFIDHPKRPISVSILSSHVDDPAVFEAVLDGMRAI